MSHKKLKLMGFAMIVLLVITVPAFAETEKFSIGVIGGWAWSITEEAIEGFSETEFKSSEIYGGSIMYGFSSDFALELCIEHLAMELEKLGDNFGTLNMTPVMLLFRFRPIGILYADIGAGINLTSFDKGSFITDLEETSGDQFTINTDNSFVFALGAGGDYFFTKNLSMSLDGLLLIENVGTSWEDSGGSRTLGLEGVEKFFVSNFQVLVGVRFWF